MSFPALFIGHGSPMNAIKESKVSDTWFQIAKEIPKPKAILVVSAHWSEPYIAVTNMKAPETIHDFGPSFPPDLFAAQYPAPGSPELAKSVQSLLEGSADIKLTEKWGLDHGAWSVLTRMYPEADIPVVELCIDSRKSDEWHFTIGRKLAPLRNEGILILASGSLVHNLRASRVIEPGLGDKETYDWSITFNKFVIDNLGARQPADKHPLVQWTKHPLALKSHPTPEHYQPLLYLLGLLDVQPSNNITTYLENNWDGPGISMLSVKID